VCPHLGFVGRLWIGFEEHSRETEDEGIWAAGCETFFLVEEIEK